MDPGWHTGKQRRVSELNEQHSERSRPMPGWLMLLGAAVLGSVALFVFVRQGTKPASELGIGSVAPPIEAAGWINGPPPKSLEGHVVVLEAWATWCGACWQLAPEVVKFYERYHPRGVVFISLTDEGPEVMDEIREFVRRNRIAWPTGYGAVATFQRYGVQGLPSLWVIGRDGRVAWTWESPESFEAAVERVLASESPATGG